MNKFATFFREISLGRFLIPLGIFLIVFGVITFFCIDNTKNYIKTEATVSKIELYEEEHYVDDTHYDATYTVYVKYTVDGKEYNEEYGVFSNYKVDDKVTISYNPSNPSEIAQPNSIILPIILIIAGIGTLIGGIVSIKNAIKRNKRLKEQEKEWSNGN